MFALQEQIKKENNLINTNDRFYNETVLACNLSLNIMFLSKFHCMLFLVLQLYKQHFELIVSEYNSCPEGNESLLT